MSLKGKDLLGLYNLSKAEIHETLKTAVTMKDILNKKLKKFQL